jgi:alpha-1,6-mannosyltransferase
LGNLGHHHVVIAPGPEDLLGTTAEAGAGTRVVRIRGRPLPYDPTYHLLARFDKVASVLDQERPDVVEAHSPYLAAAGAIVAGRRRARLVTSFWHADHLEAYVEPALARALGPRRARVGTSVLRHALRALLAPFDATFVAGRSQADKLRAVGVSSIFHVPFGVDTSTFRPGAGDRGVRERLLGTRPPAALLVGVGRLSIEKRWDVVLEAFARVSTRRAAVLVLFGDGPERKRLEARAPAGVYFAGFERDRAGLAGALAQADVLVHGCPCETSGLAVLEAVACGLPVVVPASGGALESAPPESSASYPSHDVEACAAAIERLLDADHGSLRDRARAAAARVPTADEHVARVLDIYRERMMA